VAEDSQADEAEAMSGAEQLTPFAVLEAHRAACSECDLFRLCPVGSGLLERAARMDSEKLCPGPIAPTVPVLDLDAHTSGCADCRPNALCEVGRRIAHEIGTTYIEIGVRMPKGRPC
jgi:hypothetical protein